MLPAVSPEVGQALANKVISVGKAKTYTFELLEGMDDIDVVTITTTKSVEDARNLIIRSTDGLVLGKLLETIDWDKENPNG